jgi:hypothetical protein
MMAKSVAKDKNLDRLHSCLYYVNNNSNKNKNNVRKKIINLDLLFVLVYIQIIK